MHRYNGYGFLNRIERNGAALWQANQQDASHRVTQASLGNGLSQSRTFNPNTGRLTGGLVKTAANDMRLQEGYAYDALGSVTQRQQYWDSTGFTENFQYDELNRLSSSQVVAPVGQALQSFTYDAAGNITSKTGVGSYTYPPQGPAAIRPHAVQSVGSIAGSYSYDDNGNLSSGAGKTASWSSFDMPVTLAKGTSSSTFVYGPEHQRARQVRSDGQVTIYAGAQEVETKAGAVTVKTYWPMGLGVEIDRPSQATELSWTHVDRLGSPVAITDQAGNLREKLGFDAWGKRRTLDGSATPDSLDGLVDNRGFTNHEMLDQLDLVHMNGRVYDPLTAKFMSGDPLIQDPMNGQNYSRYSYVLNNPTNFTDPTGFSCTGTRIQGGGCGGHSVRCEGDCGAVGRTSPATGQKGKEGQTDMTPAQGSPASGRVNDASGNLQAGGKAGGAANGAEAPAGAAGSPGTVPISDNDWTGALADGIDKVGQFAISATGSTPPGLQLAGGLKVLSMMFRGARLGETVAEDVTVVAGSIRNVNSIGGKMNCVNCAVATDATIAGRAASALPGGPYRIDSLEKMYRTKFDAPGSINKVSEALSAAGPGARGIVFGSRGNEVGHVFNVVNQNGAVRFFSGFPGFPDPGFPRA